MKNIERKFVTRPPPTFVTECVKNEKNRPASST
jgi:hypothetical protein